MAQEQITEEINKFQESFEEIVKRIERLEKNSKAEQQIQMVNSRIGTLEQDQHESMAS